MHSPSGTHLLQPEEGEQHESTSSEQQNLLSICHFHSPQLSACLIYVPLLNPRDPLPLSPILYCNKTTKPSGKAPHPDSLLPHLPQPILVPLKLFKHVIRSADLDFPHPPQCCPGTCAILLCKTLIWMLDVNRQSDVLWLHGPAGAGKTTLAHTIHDYAKKLNVTCATIGFSVVDTVQLRGTTYMDPTLHLLVTIAYGLASVHKGYGKWVTRTLATSRSLLKQDPHAQLEKLLITPFFNRNIKQKFLIIVDGLDACEPNHESIVNLIVGTAKAPNPPPLIWVLCTRQEPSMFSSFHTGERSCWTEELSRHRLGLRHDIEVYLRHGFETILHKNWPSQEYVDGIVAAAGGSFAYVTSILDFIKDPPGHPDMKVWVVPDNIDAQDPTSLLLHTELTSLTPMYTEILSRLPRDLLLETLQFFGAYTFDSSLSALELANLFHLSQQDFYYASRRLSTVAIVPPPEMASDRRLDFHITFLDFLSNPNNNFGLHRLQIHDRVIEACFRTFDKTKVSYAQNLAWKPNNLQLALSLAHRLFNFAATHAWKPYFYHRTPSQTSLWDIMVDFDFRHLEYLSGLIPAIDFVRYLCWLHKVSN